MSDLKIVDLYDNNTLRRQNQNFKENLRSSLQVDTLYDRVDTDYEWLDLMEDTIRYLDNILRSPNRFIVNEEEIVKVELARKITVDSIRHLAKHTNLIQDINENDEVMPSKILNINKEESYDTYENKLIYTLINRMRDFVEIKKRNTLAPFLKDTKKLEYQGRSIVGKEKVEMSLVINSKLDTQKNQPPEEKSIDARIEKLEVDINALTNTEVYRDLKKKNIAMIIPPIKKTNLILKNNNFQYAMRLWDYIQTNVDSSSKRIKENKNYEDTGILKEYVSETFLLNYVALCTLNKNQNDRPKEREIIEELTNNLIERIVELNADLPEEKLQELIGNRILVARTKKVASLSEVQGVFSRYIKLYLEKIENFTFEGDK